MEMGESMGRANVYLSRSHNSGANPPSAVLQSLERETLPRAQGNEGPASPSPPSL